MASPKSLFPGTFNPFTDGHMSVYRQACQLFGENNVYIGVAQNLSKNDVDQDYIKWTINSVSKNVIVIPKTSLVSDFCKNNDFKFMIRSLRNTMDFVTEMDLAHWNRVMGVQTIFLPCEEGMEKISSSALRQLKKFNKPLDGYLPPEVYDRWTRKPKRILVSGKIGAGKSSFLEKYFPKKYVDMDKVAKEILPKELLDKLKEDIDVGCFEFTLWEESAKILTNYILKSDYKVFEVSALGTYSKLNTKVNRLYKDSFIVNITKYDTGKERVIDKNYLEKMRKIQVDPPVIDLDIDGDDNLTGLEIFNLEKIVC